MSDFSMFYKLFACTHCAAYTNFVEVQLGLVIIRHLKYMSYYVYWFEDARVCKLLEFDWLNSVYPEIFLSAL